MHGRTDGWMGGWMDVKTFMCVFNGDGWTDRWMNIWMDGYIDGRMHAHIHVCMYLCMYVCMYVCKHGICACMFVTPKFKTATSI